MTKVIVTFSAKGGSGTSVMTLNLAVYLAQKGKKVLLVDAAPGCGSLHAYLNVPSWELSRTVPDFFSVLPLIDTDYPNLKFFSSLRCDDKSPGVQEYLIKWDAELKKSGFDMLIMDLGSYLDADLIAAAHLADLAVLFVNPDPISIEKANHLFRAFFATQLETAVQKLDIAATVQDIQRTRPEHLYCARNLLLLLSDELPRLRRSIADVVQRLRIGVVINGVRTSADAELKELYPLVIRNYYGFDLKGFGDILYSDIIQNSSLTLTSAVTSERGGEFIETLDGICGRLVAAASKRDQSQVQQLAPLTYYEMLGVHPGSSAQDIRAQYERLRGAYLSQSPLMRDLFDADSLYLYNRLLESVYQSLMDPDIKREYDMEGAVAAGTLEQALPEGFDIREVIRKYNRQKKSAPALVKRDVFGREASESPLKGETYDERDPGAVVARFGERRLTGADLRTIREEMGISIKTVCEKTRIAQMVIRAIEGDDHAYLPGITYLKGFLRSYCRALRLSEQDTERFIADLTTTPAAGTVPADEKGPERTGEG